MKRMKHIHRLVVLPDYQGLGIGGMILNKIADLILSEGNRCGIITSAPSLIYLLKKSPIWYCKAIGGKVNNRTVYKGSDVKRKVLPSASRRTVSFEYNPK